MRIRELLALDPVVEAGSDLVMQQIANAFTRRGQLKGLLGLGHTANTALYDLPPGPEPEEDPGVNLSGVSPTPTPRAVPNPHQGAELSQVSTSNLPISAIDLAGRQHSCRGTSKGSL